MSQRRTEPVELEIGVAADGYELLLHADQIYTSIGRHPVRHEARPLIEHMISEFLQFPEIEVIDAQIVEPQVLSAYRLFGLQKEFIESRSDNVSENFAFELVLDPALTRVAGPEFLAQDARYEPVANWLESEGLGLVDLDYVDLTTVDCPDDFVRMSAPLGGQHTDRFHRLADALFEQFQALSPEERACVVYLHNGLNGALVHALGLVAGALTPNDFAAGVGAAQFMLDQFPDVSSNDHSAIFAELRGYATTALEYVRSYRAGTLQGRLRELLSDALEGTDVEFKSTLRWNIKTNSKDRDITDAVVKTVAAFLNTRGGTLLIGVADDKEIVGIERDEFDADDDFLRHLYQMLANSLGPSVAPLVDVNITDTGRGKVCMVDCKRSPEPLLCKTKSIPDAFFVRTGPATVNLVGDDRETFKRLHWEIGSRPQDPPRPPHHR